MDHKVKLYDGQEKLSLLIEKEENRSLEALRLSHSGILRHKSI